MSQLMSGPSARARNVALGTLVSAAVALATVMVASPATASAAGTTCDPGDFCMWYDLNEAGGLYHFGGNDRNLQSDRFENRNVGSRVGDNTRSVWNRGVNDPSGRVDVVAFADPGYKGAGVCIPQGRKANLPPAWANRISSYKFVTSSECGSHQPLPRPGPGGPRPT